MAMLATREVALESKRWGTEAFQVPLHLEPLKMLGGGAYGRVASFRDVRSSRDVAVKKIRGAFVEPDDGKRILREVKLLGQLRHENIIQLLDIIPPQSPDFEDVYLVTELMASDLQRVIYSGQQLCADHHTYFTWQILQGLAYLHSVGVVHRDLKPANIFVDKMCGLKIGDFGLARVLSADEAEDGMPDHTKLVVTLWYRAPELIALPGAYTKAIDLWSVGCILGELIRRKPLFPGKDEFDQMKKIVAFMGTPTAAELQWLPPGCMGRTLLETFPRVAKVQWNAMFPVSSEATHALLNAMLCFDPESRVTVQEALKMDLFRGIPAEHSVVESDDGSPGTTIDWSFDRFEPTKARLQERIYCECARFHPDILERDQELLRARGMELTRSPCEALPLVS